jgi:putative ABC transport system substrate-binding protein
MNERLMKLWRNQVWFFISLILLGVILGLFFIFSPPHEEPKRIGVLLYQKTPTTVSFLEGLQASLAEQGYYQGRNLYLYVENLQSTLQAVASTLDKLEKERVDLVITTGKDLTIATARTIQSKPVIFALVTDPIRDETIKSVVEQSRTVTGISYFTPYDRTLDLSKRMIANFKKMAVVVPEGYSWPDLDKLKIAAGDAGLDLSVFEVPLDKVPETIIALSGKIDAIYLPNEIKLIMQRELIQKALLQARIPAISNNLGFQYASVLTYFADPETIGEITGRMVVKIFHGANTEFMPVELSSYFKLVVNQGILKQLNIKLSEDVLSYANEVIK